jgi:prepilin-type N-terminal cleavage/methylation domain-containing protein
MYQQIEQGRMEQKIIKEELNEKEMEVTRMPISMTKKIIRGQRGFTLIELLIVITILGIMAAVGIPLLQGALTNGKIAAANTEVSEVKVGAQAYEVGHPSAASTDSTAIFNDGDISVLPSVDYTINLNTFAITAVNPTTYPNTTATFNTTSQTWVKP